MVFARGRCGLRLLLLTLSLLCVRAAPVDHVGYFRADSGEADRAAAIAAGASARVAGGGGAARARLRAAARAPGWRTFTFAAEAGDAAAWCADHAALLVGCEPVSDVRVAQASPPPPPPPGPAACARVLEAAVNANLDLLDGTSDNLFAPSLCPSGTAHVFILDTGISPHPDFGARLSPLGFCSLNATACAADGTLDKDGHGTVCAGIAAGSLTGVAPLATLHAVKVLSNDGFGRTNEIIAGIEWVERQVVAFGVVPAVASMSFSAVNVTTSGSSLLDKAVASLVAAGVVVVAAAGNGGGDACNFAPGSSPAALTVGFTDGGASFVSTSAPGVSTTSDFGACVDLLAPGLNVSGPSNLGSGYKQGTGTSFAAPSVAGAAALLLSSQPCLSPAQVGTALTTRASGGTLATNVPSGTTNIFLDVDTAFVAAAGLSCGTSPLASGTAAGFFTLPVSETLRAPRGVAVDQTSGSVYFADFDNGAVKRMSPQASGSTFTTVFSGNGPSGVAVDPTGSVLYIADARTCVLTRLSLLSGGIVALTTMSSTGLCPVAVALDATVSPPGSALLVANATGSVLRFVLSNASLSTLFTGLSAPTGVASSNASFGSYIVVADGGSRLVGRTAANPSPQTLSIPGVTSPRGVAFSPLTGSLYVADSGLDHVVVASSPFSPSPSMFSLGSGLSELYGIAVGPLGDVFVSSLQGNGYSSPYDYGGAAEILLAVNVVLPSPPPPPQPPPPPSPPRPPCPWRWWIPAR